MVLSNNDAFDVVWDDPRRSRESWVLDRLHCPWPLPPLSQEMYERLLAIAFGVPVVYVNGYAFGRDFGPPLATAEVEARGPIPIWEEEFEPKVRTHCLEMRSRNYDSMSAEALVAALPAYFDETATAFRYTTIVIFAFMRPTAALIKFLEAELGEQGGGLAARLLQGFENETTSAGMGLGELTAQAASLPEVSSALREGRWGEVAKTEGGREFLAALRQYLAEFGWRSDTWYMFHLPTWAEDETLAMFMIGRYLAADVHAPAGALARSASVREEALRETEAQLAPDKVPRFRELLAASNDHAAISEGRAFWQLQICGSARAPVIALGRKLVETGALEQANDIFFLALDQVRAAVKDPSQDWQQIVEANKAQLARWQQLSPPSYLGVPPSMDRAPPDLQSVMRHLRGYGVERSQDQRRINGMGASKGVVTGQARVIQGLDGAGRLQPGDILVTRTTAPPWTSLFSIAGGVVTDAGGILSHTAICAREYGIPAVVATQVATAQIPDGAMVTIDGSKGTVVIAIA
jgi:phosphohistidine swiveling domain-containing protein